MSLTVYIPKDSAARSVGAEQVADAAAAQGLDIVRTGSYGLYWLEPVLEVESDSGERVAWGNVAPDDIAEIFADPANPDRSHATFLGAIDDLPWMTAQERVLFARCGRIDPLDIVAYEERGGFGGLRQALSRSAHEICQTVLDSGLRGRGGAGFPAGIKWNTVRGESASQKYICCNADEGDSATFADRMLMEGDPFLLIEGMIIAAIACGATKAFVYIRSEYPDAIAVMDKALVIAREHGWLGQNIGNSDHDVDMEIRVGAGAYICGEETAMLESLEGNRGMVRAKPPIPAMTGLFGKPTLVHNVLTLASVPDILARGSDWYKNLGSGRSTGTQPFQLAGNIRFGGLFEAGFGMSLSALVNDIGGGTRTGQPVKAVQTGGPLGAWIPAARLDVPMTYEDLADVGAMLGHGGITVAGDGVNMADMARRAMEFCAVESCGKCTPCRIGSQRGVEVIDKILAGQNPDMNREVLTDLCDLMTDGSLCAMGGLTPMPVESALKHFPEDFGLNALEETEADHALSA